LARVCILYGGPYHDFEATTGLISDLLRRAGHAVCTDRSPEVLLELAGRCDVLLLNMLRWTQQPQPVKPTLSEPQRKALRNFLAAGGGPFIHHAGVCCFDDWQDWPQLAGGVWAAGRSHHPAPDLIRIRHTADGLKHPAVSDIADFDAHDELYCDLALQDGVKVLLTGSMPQVEKPQPVCWTYQPAGAAGRTLAFLLGHHARSLLLPAVQRIILNGIRWLSETAR